MSHLVGNSDTTRLDARIEHLPRLNAAHARLLWDFVRATSLADRHARFLCLRSLDTETELVEAFGGHGPDSETLWTRSTDGRVTAIANLARLPGGRAEFALLVRSDLGRRGLGTRLLHLCLARARGLDCHLLWGLVSADNHRMRALARKYAFRSAPYCDETFEISRLTGTRTDRPAADQP